MCGIAGIIGTSNPETFAKVDEMVQALRHRGPDDYGVQQLGEVTLGHSRLSIIDLELGKQPMASRDKRYWITFNGEIYNYRELRSELEKSGYRFQTHSDTEVLLAVYQHYGTKGFSRLNGMFSFAIWDTKERIFCAARDRMGKKPFYYSRQPNGRLLFASEIKALLRTGLVKGKLSSSGIDAFLTLGYLPSNLTVFSNIETLPPGHFFIYKDKTLSLESYWQPQWNTLESMDEIEAVEELQRITEQAVRYRMIADVPIGAFLSGGLDSSTIVSLMQRQSNTPVKTFSVGFKDLINELPFAKAVADQEKTEHFEIQMDLPVGELLGEMAKIYDEPFADSSNIPTYMVCKYASEQVKVVLTGDGGDEIFGGYDRWYRPLLESEYLPKSSLYYGLLRVVTRSFSMIKGLGPPFDSFFRRLWQQREYIDFAKKYPDLWDRHFHQVTRFPGSMRRKLLNNRQQSQYLVIRPTPTHPKGIDRSFKFDMDYYLPGDILAKVDRAAMATGLETRCPLLDPNLVEYSLSLPWRLKIRNGSGKYIFKQAFKHLWPTVVQHREKQGFGAPDLHWLRNSDVRDLVETSVLGPNAHIHEILEKKILSDGISRFYSKQYGFTGNQMWSTLSLGLWLDEWSPYLENYALY